MEISIMRQDKYLLDEVAFHECIPVSSVVAAHFYHLANLLTYDKQSAAIHT